jgi:putative SOS response-associated peptidase YedK
MRRFVQAFSAGEGFPADFPHALRESLYIAPDRYNIAVRKPASVILLEDGKPVVEEFQWGLIPRWSKTAETPYTTVTARLERAAKSRLFKDAWETRHCVVLLNGYYKWDRTRKPAVPHFIQQASGQALCIAGLWEAWVGEDGTELRSFAMLTHESSAIPPPLTPDGPVFLSPRAAKRWLGASTLLGTAALHVTRPPTLVSYPVSAAYMDRTRNGYTLIEPADASEHVQGSSRNADGEDEDDEDQEEDA